MTIKSYNYSCAHRKELNSAFKLFFHLFVLMTLGRDFVSIFCGDIPWWEAGIGASHSAAAEFLPPPPSSTLPLTYSTLLSDTTLVSQAQSCQTHSINNCTNITN